MLQLVYQKNVKQMLTLKMTKDYLDFFKMCIDEISPNKCSVNIELSAKIYQLCIGAKNVYR